MKIGRHIGLLIEACPFPSSIRHLYTHRHTLYKISGRSMRTYYLTKLKDSVWPGDILATEWPSRSMSERKAATYEASHKMAGWFLGTIIIYLHVLHAIDLSCYEVTYLLSSMNILSISDMWLAEVTQSMVPVRAKCSNYSRTKLATSIWPFSCFLYTRSSASVSSAGLGAYEISGIYFI